jgi:hypothetical protein
VSSLSPGTDLLDAPLVVDGRSHLSGSIRHGLGHAGGSGGLAARTGAFVLAPDHVVAVVALVERPLLDDDGAVIPEIHEFEDVAEVLGGSDTTDVSGGMAGKVRKLLALTVPASIFAPADLAAFLDGDAPGTVIRGSNAT